MNRTILCLLVSLCWCGPIVTARGQTTRPDATEVLKQLLAVPAPMPRGKTEATEPRKQRPRSFFNANNPPPDDSPVEDLIDYWTEWVAFSKPVPSSAVRERLLIACLDDPPKLVRLISLLPLTNTAFSKVKNFYDNAPDLPESMRDAIKEWLMLNSNFYVEELIALANKAKDNERVGSVENREALVALAKRKWEIAEPLLRRLELSPQPRSAALAHSLFYEHAIKEKDSAAEERYRDILQTIASNREQPTCARDIAIVTLSSTEWSGRDEWYLGLFQDETLIDPNDNGVFFAPLATVVFEDPDKWIPVMARLVESKDLTVRSVAANSLLVFHYRSPRKDALLPLLPWLSDPAWIEEGHINDRLVLIQSIAQVDLPESVPGLLSVIENAGNSADNLERSYAAQLLGKYKDVRAIAALQKAVTIETDDENRKRIIEGLLACQPLTDTEQLQALEAYAAMLTTAEGREKLGREEPLPLMESIGEYLSNLPSAPDSLVHAVLTRAENLKPDKLALAQALLNIVHHWEGRQVELDKIRRIGNGSAEIKTITQALERRAKIRESLNPELRALSATNGPAKGIAAVLLGDGSMAQGILASEDQFAQIALLACSRLTHTALPVDLVGPMLRSKNELLAVAAEGYLLVEDSREAQQLLWKHHQNKAFVTGWGKNSDLEFGRFDQIAKMEEKLRAELFQENGPVEIIALLDRFENRGRILRIFPDRAVYTKHEDQARHLERAVSKAELAFFKQFVLTKGITDLGPQFGPCHYICTSETFLTLTKEKGRRVYSTQPAGIWMDVRDNLDLLGRGDSAKIRYKLEDEIKGLEILYAGESSSVKDVWQRGSEIRIYLERHLTPKEIQSHLSSGTASDDGLVIDKSELATVAKARFSWRIYSDKKLGRVTSQPDIYSTIDKAKFPRGYEDDVPIDYDDPNVQKLTDDSIIIAANYRGLWKQLAGTKAVRISSDEDVSYTSPIVTPDARWVVVTRTASGSQPSYLVRYDLQTGREHRVNIEPADFCFAVAFVAPHGKVLVYRGSRVYGPSARSATGRNRPEYFLLDPATGVTQTVSGEFAPLHESGRRFLQPADKPNEFWAAIAEGDKTQVGRYNLKDFTFKPVLTVPHISFESMSMWVDENQKKLYLVYRGQLLRLPLP